jgi:hypothetical protein
MKPKSPRIWLALCAAAVLCAVVGYWLFLPRIDSSQELEKTSRPIVNGGDVAPPSFAKHSTDTVGAKQELPAASITTASGRDWLKELAHSPSMLDAMVSVKKTSDPSVKQFALYSEGEMCGGLRIFRSLGFQPLYESKAPLLPSVSKELQADQAGAIDEIVGRCKNRDGESQLRADLKSELAREGLLVPLFTSEYLGDGNTEKMRALLPQAFDGRIESLSNLFFLRKPLAQLAGNTITPEGPELTSLDDRVRLASIAIEVALCRSGMPCDAGTPARSSVCTRFGECSATSDVEAAYRRLHILYGVPFSLVESVTSTVLRAFREKSVATLVP